MQKSVASSSSESDASSLIGSAGSSSGSGGITCPSCSAENTADQRFCGDCGGRLWEPCVDCGEANAANRRFCGSCGVDLQERLNAVIAECETKLGEAHNMAKEGYYLQAVDLLAAVRLVEHSQLRSFEARFERRTERYRKKREEVATDGQRVLEETLELQETGHLREALRAAKQIPPALRSRELSKLHDSLQERVKLADRLRSEIKEALQKKEYVGLTEKAERLGDLEPWDAKHRELLAKLKKRQEKTNAKAAEKQLAKARHYLERCEYRKSASALAQMATDSLEENKLEAFRELRETVWLASEAARSPYVDAASLAIVDRLVERQPHDERAQQLASSMRNRRERSLAKSPGRPVRWAQPRELREGEPSYEHAGCPALLAAELSSRGLSPGQFLCAFGLALQGIGKAEHSVDLAIPTKGVLGAITSVAQRRPAKAAWGIDCGGHSLKAIRLSIDTEDKKNPTIKLEEVVLIAHDFSGGVPTASDRGASLAPEVKKSLDKFLQQHELAGERAVVGLPAAQTLGRFFLLPYLSASKFANAVKYESRARIPVDESEVQVAHLDWELPEEDSDGVKQRRVALVAATNAHINARMLPLMSAKPGRIEVTSTSLALANATQYDAAALGVEHDDSYAVAAVGATGVAIVAPGSDRLWFRGLYGGSAAFDKAVVQQLGVSWSQAEKLRRKPQQAKYLFEVHEAIEKEIDELALVVRRAVAQYIQESGCTLSKVLLCGGAADQFGLIHALRHSDG